MLTIRHNDQSYSVVFDQTQGNRLDKRGFEDIAVMRAGIWRHDPELGPVLTSMGYAHKSPLDADDPAAAAELAFGRALKRLFPKTRPGWREARAKFWAAYRDATQRPADPQPELPSAPAPSKLTTAEQTELAERVAAFEKFTSGDPSFCGAGRCSVCNDNKARIAELRAKEAA